MGILATHKNELIYIYSDQSKLGKKVLAYATSNKKPMRSINIEKEKIPNSVWLEIADMVNKPIKDLFSPELTVGPGFDSSTDYNADDLLKIVNKNPSLLQHPIAILGDRAVSISDRFDFLEFYEKDGSNFDKSKEAIKNGEHKDTTNGEGMNNIINASVVGKK